MHITASEALFLQIATHARRSKIENLVALFFHPIQQENTVSKLNTLAVASIAFGIQLLAGIASANAGGGCAPAYASCQQTCRNYSAGGKDFGVALWDASRSKACFQGCLTERNKCNIASIGHGSTTVTEVNSRRLPRP